MSSIAGEAIESQKSGTKVPLPNKTNGTDPLVSENMSGTKVPLPNETNGTDTSVSENMSGTTLGGTKVPLPNKTNGTDPLVSDNGWRKCKLGDIAEIKTGKSNAQDSIPNGIYPLFDRSQIIKQSNRFLFDDEAIIVAGEGKEFTPRYFSGKFDLHQRAYAIHKIIKAVPKFIFYAIWSNKEYFESVAVGSTVMSLRLNHFTEFPLLLPPLEEQKAIAEVLSSLDDKIDLLHRQNRTLESLAQTLFRQWFIDGNGTLVPSNETTSGAKAPPPKEEWEEKPLKEICEIINGFAFKSGDYRENGRTIIRTMNFKNGFIDNSDVVYIDIQEEIKYTKYQLQKNDFLLVMVGASLGNFAIVTNDILPALQNQNMWNFRTLGNVSQHYLNFAMRQIVEENISSASGSAREFFQKGQFYEFMIKVPDASLMNKFHHNIENFYQKIENNRKQIQTLENLRDTLLPKLLSGEVRVEI